MHVRARTAHRLILAAAALLVLIAPAAAGARVPRNFYGVMFDGRAAEAPVAVQDRQFATMAASGVESTRYVFDWSAIQPSSGGGYDWSRTDQAVELAAARGITVLPVMMYAPYWARVYRRYLLSPPRTGPYLAWLRAAVRRYRPGGDFWRARPGLPQRPIRYWQVWNEPNIQALWRAPRRSSYGWPQGYARLLRAANRTIKSADRGAKTVTAGIVGISWLELRRLYKFKVKGSFDVVALHVYPQTQVRVREAVRRIREELVRAGDRRRRIFVTEVSFPASRGRAKPIKGQRQDTPATMARGLSRLYSLLIADRRRTGLDRVYWYTWSSDYVRRSSNFNFAGLLASPDGLTFRAQPALAAYRRSAARYEGCAKTEFGTCR